MGVDIEPNCLNNPQHPLFIIDKCKNLYTELLLNLKNLKHLQQFGTVLLTLLPQPYCIYFQMLYLYYRGKHQ